MKKLLLAWFLIVQSGLLSCSNCEGQTGPQNLAENPSFEESRTNEPNAAASWDTWSTHGKSPQVVTGVARTGRQCLELSCQGTSGAFMCAFQELPVVPGSEYEFSVYVRNAKLQGAAHGSLGIEWRNAEGAEIGRNSSERWTLAASRFVWERYALAATAPAGAERARFVIHFSDGDPAGSGSCYVDDVVIYER